MKNPINTPKLRIGSLVLAGVLVLPGCATYGRHWDHPHGGPPGQLKKQFGGYKTHPHGAPPGQKKKYLGGYKGHPHGIPPGQRKKLGY